MQPEFTTGLFRERQASLRLLRCPHLTPEEKVVVCDILARWWRYLATWTREQRRLGIEGPCDNLAPVTLSGRFGVAACANVSEDKAGAIFASLAKRGILYRTWQRRYSRGAYRTRLYVRFPAARSVSESLDLIRTMSAPGKSGAL